MSLEDLSRVLSVQKPDFTNEASTRIPALGQPIPRLQLKNASRLGGFGWHDDSGTLFTFSSELPSAVKQH